ncbi:MAG TPA: MaoC family dehydratase [Casimicrobiaceae bacterium]|nr:MaoC family dehydratase [Casimicrobiaceae bacterium]
MNEHAMPAPVDSRYFEDYIPGTVFDCGSIAVDPTEIVAFATRYDPQYFHTDPEAAKRSAFGGLIASGWHTAGLTMRLLISGYLSSVASLGSPGIDELRWTRPVRPGDVLHVRVTVLEAKRSRSKPDRGIVQSLVEVTNQNGESVMSFKGMNLFLCR